MIHLADVSEFQGVIDWPTYGKHFAAVIVRAHNGSRPDRKFAQNRDGARANVAIRGWYHYLKANFDPAKQAAGFCNTVADLLPGEFVVVDVEEGSGSQVERAQAWMAVVDKRLATRSWLYSGQAFAQAHLGSLVPFHDRNVWLANYRKRPPDLPCTLWQHTDAEAHVGIRSPCDCSIYFGSAAELAAVLGAQPTPTPAPVPPIDFPGDHMQRIAVSDATNPLSSAGTGFWDCDGGSGRPRIAFDKLAAAPFVNGADGFPADSKGHNVEPYDHGGIVRLRMWGFEGGAVPLIFVPVAT